MGRIQKQKAGDLVLYNKFEKTIKKSGTGAAVLVPRKYLGLTAQVEIVGPKPFICNECIETIALPENFSPEKDLCMQCYLEKKAMEEGKCVVCGGPDPIKHCWARCEKCLEKEGAEIEKDIENDKKLSEEELLDKFQKEYNEVDMDKRQLENDAEEFIEELNTEEDT